MKGYTAASAAQFPSQVVSDLQANPDVNYIAMASGQMMSGVPQVLSAAGLTSKVKIITKAGTNLNFELLKAGTYQQADIGFSMDMYAWGAVDAVARILAGQGNNLPTYDATEILTPSNINFNPATTNSWSIQGYQAMFKKSWGVK
jgi:ABC-type sugar transport system substrate-binding protein